METILVTNKLTKHYGRIKAVDKLDLEINKGVVFGILGPNGSGKTTTLGMILDVINITSGSYQWFGENPVKEHRMRIGAILETPIFYPYLTGAQNLQLVCLIKGVETHRINVVLEQVDLFDRKHHKFKTYSLGMKQRLSIASALLCDPEVMILDEPTNGLDPQGIADIRQLIINIAQEGKTIVLASHLLDEVQKVCSDFAVLKSGSLIYSGKVSEVSHGDHSVEVMAEQPIDDVLQHCDFVTSVSIDSKKYIVKLKEDIPPAQLNSYLFEKGVVISHLVAQHKSLEKQFLEILNESE